MTLLIVVLSILLVIAVAALGVVLAGRRGRPGGGTPRSRTRRILFPFVTNGLSPRALDAALRLAAAEEATLVPIFLARVPLNLPLDAPLPRQCGLAIPLQEAIEQRAAQFGVPVDARIERGRTYRHGLRQTIAGERFDRIVIAAAAQGQPGFDADDVAWLLNYAPGEIVVLRPDRNGKLLAPAQPRARGRAPRRPLARALSASGEGARLASREGVAAASR